MATTIKETPPRTATRRGTEIIATFPTYAEAQEAVDRLSDAKFGVRHVSIVGEGLKFVEQVTGRFTWWKALLQGFGVGALLGLFVALLFGLFVIDPVAWLNILFAGLIFGAAVGAIFHLLGYLATRGKRDFSSVGSFGADQFSVVCDASHADEARRLLAS